MTDGMVVSSMRGAAVLFRVICIGECTLSEIWMESDILSVCFHD